jgi:hypothetical protein
MKKSAILEVLKVEDFRMLDCFDVLKILREEGIVYGSVVLDSARLVKRCHGLGFKPNDLKFLFF